MPVTLDFDLSEESRFKAVPVGADYLPVTAEFSVFDPRRPSEVKSDFIIANTVWTKLANIRRDKPCLLFVEGEYGMGKTTLLFHAAQSKPHGLQVLPIRLSEFRLASDGSLWKRILGQLKGLLLSDIEEQTLLQEVRMGGVVLALDGVDEWIRENDFGKFAGDLLDLLGGRSFGPFRVIVSARSEFMELTGNHGVAAIGRYITQSFRELAASGPTICHFELKGYSTSTTKKLLGLDDIDGELAEYLKRPVMASIYRATLVANDGANPASGDRLKLADILKRYVSGAIQSKSNLVERFLPEDVPVLWDVDALAAMAKRGYATTGGFGGEFDFKSVSDCLAPGLKGKVGDATVEYLVHKCPFLMRCIAADADARGRFEFIHRIFFEYFAARGVWDEAAKHEEAARKNPDEPGDRFTTFDDLVLRVDTRKFLRELAGPAWFDRTRRAYALDLENHKWSHPAFGLESAKEWRDTHKNRLPEGKTLDQLDYDRCLILAMMTYPNDSKDLDGELRTISELFPSHRHDSKERSIAVIERAIDRFLDQCLDQEWMHPRYLVPSLEPIAQYLFHVSTRHKRKSSSEREWRSIEGRFDKFVRVLESCYELAKKRYLHERERYPNLLLLHKGYGLLMERCLSIGLRLRQPWVQSEVHRAGIAQQFEKSGELLDQRIEQICWNTPAEPRWTAYRL